MSLNPYILSTYKTLLKLAFRVYCAVIIALCVSASNSQAYEICDSFPEDQRDTLNKDVSILRQIRVEIKNKWLLKIFESERFDQKNLINWINERVRFLIPEGYFDTHWARIQDTDYTYQNPGMIPENAFHFIFGMERIAARKALLSQNVGVDLYIQGKSAGKVLLYQNPRGELEQVKSPRVGLVQLGLNFFNNPLEKFKMPNNAQNRIAYSLFRIAALVHEGRHSDGNSSSLGFLHATCPEGHDLAGLSSCDKNLNGPYEIEGLLLFDLLSACSSCMEKEKEILRLSALDDLSRVIKKIRIYISPERRKECDAIKEKQAKAGTAIELPPDCLDFAYTGSWDAAPEGNY